MRKERKHVFLLWIRTILILTAFTFAALSMFWAVFCNTQNNLRNLEVHVADFDSQVAPYNKVEALVGPVITNLARKIHSSSLHQSLGYRISPHLSINTARMAVRRAVYNWDAWAAVVINPNATSALLHAVLNGDSSYDPTGAVQYIIQTARQESTTNSYIVPQLQILMSQSVTRFGAAWSKMLLTNSSFSSLVMAEASAAVSPGIVPLKIDIRPFEPSTATPAVTMGLVYLIVVSFFSFSFLLPIHNKYIQPQGHPPLHFWHLIIWRWVATVVLYLFISLAYSLVCVAFGVPLWQPSGSAPEATTNTTAYGPVSFTIFWQVNFLGMVALGLASENAVMVLGQRLKTQIIFDLKSEIVLNFGVLMAWAVINTALFPICCDFMRWRRGKQQKEALKAHNNQCALRRPAVTKQKS
ncbi:MNNG and nitrosoguanidine resistance protein [Xylaria sp. FL0064]|nr:MNNG and nitrosoguanidine resistance protein [Xylaria sp. FL0064]